MVIHREKQPDYKLKHEIEFTDLDKVVFRQEKLNKKDILDHYNKISEYLLPYLKNRKHLLKPAPNTSRYEIPSWFDADQIKITDKDHLLYCVEMSVVEFDIASGADHLLIGIDSGSGFEKAITAANVMHDVLEGLRLPSFVKTDGVSGLHAYVPPWILKTMPEQLSTLQKSFASLFDLNLRSSWHWKDRMRTLTERLRLIIY